MSDSETNDDEVTHEPRTAIPTLLRCAWCWIAAGRTLAAWRALEDRDFEQTLEHAVRCDHNPLVKLIREYVAAMSSDEATDEADERTIAAYDAIKAAAHA